MKVKFLLIILPILLTTCQSIQDATTTTTAKFTLLKDADQSVEAEVGVFGGSGKEAISPIQSNHLEYTISDDCLHLNYTAAGYLKISPAVLGFPQKWQGVSSISLQISTDQPTDLLLELWGRRSRLPFSLSLKPGKYNYQIDVRETALLGGLEWEVLQLNLQSSAPSNLYIHQFQLHHAKTTTPLVDRWGQRLLAEFPSKINRNGQLSTVSTENAFLDSLSFPFTIDAYGGFNEHELPLESTGFFHTQQIEDKWYLISPAGNPFYSFGLNGVRRKSTLNNAALTRVKGREHLFEKLPDYQDCPECFSPDSAYLSFYCQNVKTKYSDYKAWKQQTTYRFKKIGFNTVGNWSDSLFLGGPIPYTVTLDTRVFTNLLAAKHLPDVFHPNWEHRLDSAFASITQFADDAFLLGYFVDNEMPWASLHELDSTSYAYQALSPYTSLPEKQSVFAEKYFSTVKKVLKKYDPNHLYLGCRFTRNLKTCRAAAKVAGKHLDVLSVNVYSPFAEGEMDAWYQTVQKPILIGEHHIPPQTKKALLPRYEAFPLDHRDQLVEDYLQTWISYPYAIGSHWYQYVDQEVSGREDGGENQPVGLVTVTDQLDQRLALLFFKFAQTIPDNYLK
jgi:hypothetical protein